MRQYWHLDNSQQAITKCLCQDTQVAEEQSGTQ